MVQLESSGATNPFLGGQNRVYGSFEGGLNVSTVIDGAAMGHSRKLVVRKPKSLEQRRLTEESVRAEYDGIGATAMGIDFRLRSLEEQDAFMRRAKSIGLKTLEAITLLDDSMVTEFVEGVPLNEYIRRDNPTIPGVVAGVLSHMAKAHSAGIVFGDRWVSNTMVLPDESHMELDFDIELEGPHDTTTTFELSQTLYHLVHFADKKREDVTGVISNIYTQQPHLLAGYDQTKMRHFLSGHANYFRSRYHEEGVPYEGLEPPGKGEVARLMDGLDEAWTYAPEGPITNSLSVPLLALDLPQLDKNNG